MHNQALKLMAERDLFKNEAAALAMAATVLENPYAHPADYKDALELLTRSHERLIHRTKYLITHRDRTELKQYALNAQLHQFGCDLEYNAKHDNLTGLLNRTAIFERASQYLERMSLSVLILDMDFFNSINYEFGYPTGDAVLKELVGRLDATLGEFGEVGRVDGDKFAVLLPDMSFHEALEVAGGARIAIANYPFSCAALPPISACFGVSSGRKGSRFEDIYDLANAALFIAKRKGRNRVESSIGNALTSVI